MGAQGKCSANFLQEGRYLSSPRPCTDKYNQYLLLFSETDRLRQDCLLRVVGPGLTVGVFVRANFTPRSQTQSIHPLPETFAVKFCKELREKGEYNSAYILPSHCHPNQDVYGILSLTTRPMADNFITQSRLISAVPLPNHIYRCFYGSTLSFCYGLLGKHK